MNTLPLAARRMGANVIARGSTDPRAPAMFSSPALQALLDRQDGHRRRNCAARLLHAGRGEIAPVVFRSPAPATRVRLPLIDPPWCGAARVVDVVRNVSVDGSCRARLELDRRGWDGWRSASRRACCYGTHGRHGARDSLNRQAIIFV